MNRKTKRRVTIVISYLAAAAAAFGVLAGVYYAQARQYERAMNNNYQHAFDEFVTAVGEVDSALQKSLYAMTPGVAGGLCTEVFGKAMTAQMSLGGLPFSSEELEQTAGFISRVGDYAFMLSRASAAGRELTQEEQENLRALADAASVLALNLRGMQADLQDGRLTLRELRSTQATLDDTEAGQAAWAGDSVRMIEQEFPEIPSLIYDGPFSEHLRGQKPLALEGLEEVGPEQARTAAASLLAVGRGRVWFAGELAGEIPCYTFGADDDNGATLYLSLTKAGGRLLAMLSSRPVGSAAVPVEDAVETAKAFLEGAGYTGMVETYHMTQGGILTVNFAYRQGEVLCYSDLAKVSVALDSGKVCGFEARGYLSAHRTRELPEAAVGEEQARAMVPETLEVLAHQMALTPSDGKYETLCHEFKCAAPDGRHYIIYVNAQTGVQEKILILIEDESGALTL